ncbi:hypothetical protein CKAH01_07810 [Colletotrichum kahawae]|uniref:Uncharacterized protein n=1 Tax=Colletotrichum kahawae TaxID=34407 RepID=A0AAD9Y4S4_COLKA|nr:hypothetical protein CKAH01_07810 [Colletotrichum kahawae]
MHGHTEVVKWLIQQGVSIFEDSVKVCGCPSGNTWEEDRPWPLDGPRTACVLAILHRHYTTAHVLMVAGAGVHGNQWMPNGITIWQEAVQGDDYKSILRYASHIGSTLTSVVLRNDDSHSEESAVQNTVDAVELLLDSAEALGAYALDGLGKIARLAFPRVAN